ncbi:prepilin peptidase [Erwinia sp. CPCC 100877]|nr:prepilin peptidase [Erwinia sp. CPCC 100877]
MDVEIASRYIFSGILGLCLGSFVNVVIWRVPVMAFRGNSHCFNLLMPGSRCVHCHHKLKLWQNIPLISWLALRGRCAFCHGAIAWRYPAIELLFMILTPLCWHYASGPLCMAFWLFFYGALLALAVIDVQHMLLPDMLTQPLLWGGLLFHLVLPAASPVSLEEGVLGACEGYLFLWGVYWLYWSIRRREGLGYGDFKLMAALGAWLGWRAIPGVLLAASLMSLMLVVLSRLLFARALSEAAPFGPWLALAGWGSWLMGAGDNVTW